MTELTFGDGTVWVQEGESGDGRSDGRWRDGLKRDGRGSDERDGGRNDGGRSNDIGCEDISLGSVDGGKLADMFEDGGAVHVGDSPSDQCLLPTS